MTLSAMRGARRGLVLAATGIILAAGPVRAQDADEPMPEAQHSRLPPGAVVQPLDSGPGAELRNNLRTLAENPRSLDALIGAGRAAIDLRDGEAATGFFTRAQEIAPADPRVKAGLASAALLSEHPEQALILFAEAVQRGAPEGEIAGDRGLAYDMVGDPRHAQQDYALALRHREDPEIERRLALSLAISGQRDAALHVIDAQLRRHDRAAWRTADDTARRLMPAPNAQAMAPFFARLAYLSPAQKAAAVNFGRFPSDGRATQVANVDTRADPDALALARGGPRAQPPLAAPVNDGVRRRAGAGDRPVYGARDVAPAVQPRRPEFAQAEPRRFEPNPPPDPDDEDKAEGDAQAQSPPPRQGPVDRPREAPAFVPGGNFTLDSSHEEAAPQAPAQAPAASPGFGSVGPTQAPSVRQFQSITAQPAERPAMSDVSSMVRSLPVEPGSAAQPPAPALTLAERQARDAAAREAEARYRAQSETGTARSGSPAGGRHWVQIAHTERMSALAEQYRQVRARAPALVEGRNAWTVADRSTNRLLIGPFDSERAAHDYIDQLGARRIAAIPWESAGQSIDRLQVAGASSNRTRAAEAERAPAARPNRDREEHGASSSDRRASGPRSARDRDASDDRGSAHGRSTRDRPTADDRSSSHSRSARDRSTTGDRSSAHSRSAHDRSAADDRSGSRSRSAHNRSAADDRSSSHSRSGRDRSAADERPSSHSRSAHDRDTAAERSNAHGPSASRHGPADEDRASSHARSAHGRAPADDAPRTSRNRSSQERRQAANDTRPARGRSSEEQRPAPHGRRSH
jgi:hypothetical protein